MSLRHWFWKRKISKIPPDKCSLCCICNGPIYPGQFVGRDTDGLLVHAGFHDTLNQEDVFCETGGVGIGFWNGTDIDKIDWSKLV